MRIATFLAALTFALSLFAAGPWDDLPDGGLPFRTFFVTWTHNGSPEMFDYLRAARPQVVQIGFYGPMFHGYAHDPRSTGYPMQLPVHGEREALARQAEINRQVQETLPGVKVIGHFQLCNVVENPDEPFGFIKWYDELWDVELLGEKPVADVRELLQRDSAGNVIKGGGYIDFIGLCLSSPHTRTMLKRMVSVAIDAGVDGLVSNYNYRWACVCPHCQASFKAYLAERYDADALRDRFAVADLASHQFEEIPARIPGYPDVSKATELHWAAMDWGNRQFKAAFDEIYIEHGRSIRPDFIVGTWNHLGTVGHTEERSLLPIKLWGRGEDFFWYSGSHGPGNLAEGQAGDAWLNLLWLREMAGGKPFMMGKYEGTRVRVALAEASATGGAGTGLYHPFMDETGAQVMARHLRFVHEHDELYRDATPRREVALVLPRQSLFEQKPEAYEPFRDMGQALAQQQVLFDVVLDQRLSAARLAGYRAVVLATEDSLTGEQRQMLREYEQAGGRVLTGRLDALAQTPLSKITAPWTIRTAAYDLPDGIALHLVNYNRDEAAAKELRGPAAELPIPERDIAVELVHPEGAAVQSVRLLSPDTDAPIALKHTMRDGRVSFTVPEVVVYGVVVVRLAR